MSRKFTWEAPTLFNKWQTINSRLEKKKVTKVKMVVEDEDEDHEESRDKMKIVMRTKNKNKFVKCKMTREMGGSKFALWEWTHFSGDES